MRYFVYPAILRPDPDGGRAAIPECGQGGNQDPAPAPPESREEGSASGGFVVRFPDLPEIVTQGDDLAEALAQAADALEEALAGRIDDGLDIPAPYFPTAGQYLVACPAPTAAKAALYLALRESGLSKAALAARLGVDEKEPRRLLDPHHRTKLHRLTAALEVLGKRLVVGLAEAPARGAA